MSREYALEDVLGRVSRETWFLGTICLLDLIATLWLVQRGAAVEGNPLLGFYMRFGLGAFAAAKLFLFIGPLIALEWLRERRPVFVRRMMRVAVILYLGFYALGSLHLNANSARHEVTTIPVAESRG